MFLLGNEFTAEQKRGNYRYYDPLTTSDSSLSPPVHSIVAAELRDPAALEHFRLALFMDLADVAENAVHGVHVASTGGVWMCLVYGFAGLRDFDGRISFDPWLPDGFTRLRFPLLVRGQRIRVDVTVDRMVLRLEEGPAMEVRVQGEPCTLRTEEPTTVPLEAAHATA
jgi:alpha,alpha-trehalose phosphorylase